MVLWLERHTHCAGFYCREQAPTHRAGDSGSSSGDVAVTGPPAAGEGQMLRAHPSPLRSRQVTAPPEQKVPVENAHAADTHQDISSSPENCAGPSPGPGHTTSSGKWERGNPDDLLNSAIMERGDLGQKCNGPTAIPAPRHRWQKGCQVSTITSYTPTTSPFRAY